MDNNLGNILLHQFVYGEYGVILKEVVPLCEVSESSDAHEVFLTKKGHDIYWTTLDLSLNVLVNNSFENTDIYYEYGRIGVGRSPLFNYKVDIAIPKNEKITAVHIGDGSYGFSLGNGTTSGFLPEIIGIGSDETDAGLYFLGIAGNNIASDVPLIILDARNTFGKILNNRPIFGITSGDYNNFKVLVDCFGNVKINGAIDTTDVIINGVSLLEKINDLQKQIEALKTKIT